MTEKMKSFVKGIILGLVGIPIRSETSMMELDILNLHATFNQITAESVLGESGFSGQHEFQVGFAGQKIYYDNGHLIVED